MIVLGVDPGAAGAGYALWNADMNAPIYIGTEPPSITAVHYVACESGFVGVMGRKAMWGLGVDVGWRLCELRGLAMHGMFTIRPDGKNGWRAALPARPDLPAARRFLQYDGLPGEVIVNRLRLRYGLTDPARWTEHEVEAVGIAEAAAAILSRPQAKDRRALVRVAPR